MKHRKSFWKTLYHKTAGVLSPGTVPVTMGSRLLGHEDQGLSRAEPCNNLEDKSAHIAYLFGI